MTGPSAQTLWITVAIFRRTENESQKRKTKEGVGEGRRQEGVAEGGGEGLSSAGQKLMITLASSCTDVFEAWLRSEM